MSELERDSDYQTYQTQYALDANRFFRRGCASCGLHFKLSAEVSDLSSLLAPIFTKTIGYSPVLSSSDANGETLDQLTCPYCGHTASQQEMHTEEFTSYIHKWIDRQLIQPSIRNMFADLSNSFSGNEFIQITHESSPISVQPISGPELPDMRKVRLLCCDKTIKIMAHWLDLLYCPFCVQKTVLR